MTLVFPILIKAVGNGYLVDAVGQQLIAVDKEDVKAKVLELVDAVFEAKDNPPKPDVQKVTTMPSKNPNILTGGGRE
jgi:hypothetical protein